MEILHCLGRIECMYISGRELVLMFSVTKRGWRQGMGDKRSTYPTSTI